MKILDGQLISRALLDELRELTERRVASGRRPPHLAAVLVGRNPASETYVAAKVKACEKLGFKSTLYRIEETAREEELLDRVQSLNDDPEVDGILVQLPLPPTMSEAKVIDSIDPAKDVDGFHAVNAGRMLLERPGFLPATPYGIMLLLERYRIDTRGMHAVVLGRSHIVGRPVSVLLSQPGNPGNCTVTICHSQSRNLNSICQSADIIIAAIGRPEFLRGDMVREGCIVIDVGINRVADATKKSGYALKGDVHFAEVARKSAYITPVPGGVGPMTIAALMKNTWRACQERQP